MPTWSSISATSQHHFTVSQTKMIEFVVVITNLARRNKFCFLLSLWIIFFRIILFWETVCWFYLFGRIKTVQFAQNIHKIGSVFLAFKRSKCRQYLLRNANHSVLLLKSKALFISTQLPQHTHIVFLHYNSHNKRKVKSCQRKSFRQKHKQSLITC